MAGHATLPPKSLTMPTAEPTQLSPSDAATDLTSTTTKNGRVGADTTPPNNVTATFRPHPKGFGFATPIRTDDDATEPDGIFIPPRLTRGLLADDWVDVTYLTDEKGTHAVSVTVLRRHRRMVSGTITSRAGRDVIAPDPSLATSWIALDDALAKQLSPHQNRTAVVLLVDNSQTLAAQALVAGPFIDGSPKAVRARTVTQLFGRITPETFPGAHDATTTPLKATTTHLKLTGQLAGGQRGGAGALERSGAFPGDVTAFEERRNEPCVTIDGEQSRDLDDALWAAWDRTPSGDVDVAVHIVDAARAIGIGSPADHYARVAAATTYFTVGDNAPMIDPALSEDALSLLAGVDRFVLSVRFRVNPNGTITSPVIEAAAICSRAKLSYADLDAFMDGDLSGLQRHATDANDNLANVLDSLIEAARRLGTTRDTAGSLSRLFAEITEEPAVIDGRLTVVAATTHPKANRVVERLMVAANETVAGWLNDRQAPALFRNHAGLDATRTPRVFAAAELLGINLTLPKDLAAAGAPLIANLINAVELDGVDAATRDLWLQVLAGTTARASYSAKAVSHVGLNADAYTHFTSPLRRYADLVVHRQVRACLANEPLPYSAETLQELGEWLDARLGVAAQLASAERAALWDLLLARKAVAPETTGTITAVTKPGLRLRFSARGTSGFLPAASLYPNESTTQLDVDPFELATTDNRFTVGQTIGVRFSGVDGLGRANWLPTDPVTK